MFSCRNSKKRIGKVTTAIVDMLVIAFLCLVAAERTHWGDDPKAPKSFKRKIEDFCKDNPRKFLECLGATVFLTNAFLNGILQVSITGCFWGALFLSISLGMAADKALSWMRVDKRQTTAAQASAGHR